MYLEPYDDENWTDEFMVSLLIICKKSDISQGFPSEATIRLTTIMDEEIAGSDFDGTIIGVIVILVFALVVAALAFAYLKFRRRLGGQKIEQKVPDLVAVLPQGFTEPNASNADLLNAE